MNDLKDIARQLANTTNKNKQRTTTLRSNRNNLIEIYKVKNLQDHEINLSADGGKTNSYLQPKAEMLVKASHDMKQLLEREAKRGTIKITPHPMPENSQEFSFLLDKIGK